MRPRYPPIFATMCTAAPTESDELRKELDDSETLTALEDIYLPFRPKRRTRATRAREKGLEPLAERILLQRGENPSEYAMEFIDPEKGVESVDDALAGAKDVIAEKLTEIPGTRESMRDITGERGSLEAAKDQGRRKKDPSSEIISSGMNMRGNVLHIEYWRC